METLKRFDKSIVKVILFFFLLQGVESFLSADTALEEEEKEIDRGPRIISKAFVPLPPDTTSGAGIEMDKEELCPAGTELIHDLCCSPAQGSADETGGCIERKCFQAETGKQANLPCSEYRDDKCKKCNPPVQDVGEKCTRYEKQSDGSYECTECEQIECGE